MTTVIKIKRCGRKLKAEHPGICARGYRQAERKAPNASSAAAATGGSGSSITQMAGGGN